jgi:hypothetical protein
MGCPALGIWVGFFKQPPLPGEAPQKKILKGNFKKIKSIKIVGVQSRNKCSLWNVERKEWAGLFV